MALDKVANDILEGARQEAAKRIQEAEKERAKILQETDQRIDRLQKAEDKELQETLNRMRRQELSSAELESKKVILNARKEILNRTFAETLSELSALDPKQKSALYKKMLADGKKMIHHPKVFIPKGEADRLAGLRAQGLCIPDRDRHGARPDPGVRRRRGPSGLSFQVHPGRDLGSRAEERFEHTLRVRVLW